ncbi:MAG: HlyC/CorC family transporter [Planctomycetes bacterium]|nr:HlyC/CorC family transporter [Planctomycetota bacterium]
MLSSILAIFFFFIYALLALLGDSLRFASLGFIKAKLQKRMSHQGSDQLDALYLKMERYFKDEGRNLRELEWGSYGFLFLSLYYSVQSMEVMAHAESSSELVFYFALVSFFVVGLFIRVFSEPFAEAILIKLYAFWRMVHLLFFPLTQTISALQILIVRIAGLEQEEEEEETEQKILDSMEDGKKAGVFEDSERIMIENIIEFKDRDVGEVMTPRTEMVAVELKTGIHEVIQKMHEENYSRILVYEDNRDNIVGFVHVRDLLPYWNIEESDLPPLAKVLREPNFVPDTKKIRSLFQEFKLNHRHISVVLDEYGGTAGLVTLEDILEEIVGEIIDEHQDEEDSLYEQLSEREVKANARLRVLELNEILSLEIEENDNYDSVGGLLISELGRIPAQGEQGVLKEHKIEYQVLEANERRIESLMFRKIIEESDG